MQRVERALEIARAGEAETAAASIDEACGAALEVLENRADHDETAWLQLAGRLRYRCGRMAEAAGNLEACLRRADLASDWNLLGRIYVWLGNSAERKAFARAAELDPEHYVLPYRLSRARFNRLADDSLARIPTAFLERLRNTMIVVDDLPSLGAVRDGEDPDLLGLYEGATVMEEGLPERIVLYQRNHENISRDLDELRQQIDETMAHEIGHHFGLSEDQLPY